MNLRENTSAFQYFYTMIYVIHTGSLELKREAGEWCPTRGCHNPSDSNLSQQPLPTSFLYTLSVSQIPRPALMLTPTTPTLMPYLACANFQFRGFPGYNLTIIVHLFVQIIVRFWLVFIHLTYSKLMQNLNSIAWRVHKKQSISTISWDSTFVAVDMRMQCLNGQMRGEICARRPQHCALLPGRVAHTITSAPFNAPAQNRFELPWTALHSAAHVPTIMHTLLPSVYRVWRNARLRSAHVCARAGGVTVWWVFILCVPCISGQLVGDLTALALTNKLLALNWKNTFFVGTCFTIYIAMFNSQLTSIYSLFLINRPFKHSEFLHSLSPTLFILIKPL